MPITADEMPVFATFRCPWCDAFFTTTSINDYVPLRVRDTDFDILAFCPRCGAVCRSTVKKVKEENTEK